MKDIICREDATRYFIGLRALDKITNDNYDGKITFEEVISRLGVIPSAERTGKWIWENHAWHCDQCGKNPTYGMGYVQRKEELFDFCPHCGVGMVKE